MNLERFNQKITTKVICIIAIFLWGFVALGALWMGATSLMNSRVLLVVITFIILIVITMISLLLSKYLSIRQVIGIMLMISFIVKLIWIIKVPTQPSSDFLVLHKASLRAANGDFSFMQNNYFLNWPYQLGFVLYQSMIIKFLGHSIMIIKMINIILSLATTYLVFLTGKQLFNEKVGLIGLIIMALYPQYIFFSSVLTNQYIATFCFYLGFYLLIKYHTWPQYLMSGIFLGLGNIVRPLGPLVLIAVFLFIVFYKNKNSYHKRWLTKIILIIALVGGYQFMTVGTNVIIQTTHISQYGLINRSNTWKFVTGLNYETTGTYSNQDLEVLDRYPIGLKRDAVGKKLIKERLTNKFKIVKLFMKKSLAMWSYRDSALEWSNLKQFVSLNIYQGTLLYQTIFYALMLSMSIVGIIATMIKKKTEPMLFIIVMIGYFLVHWLIEIQTRYRFFIMPAILLFSAVGIMSMYKWIKDRKVN